MSNEPIPRLLSLAERLLSARITAELSEYGLGRGEYRILFALCREEGLGQSELSQRFQLDKGVVARAADQLEEKEFVERRPDPDDGRRKLLYLTAEAEEIRCDIDDLKRTIDAEILDGLSDEEVACLSEGLETVCRNLVEANERDPPNEVF